MSYKKRIYYNDTDAGGIVYHTNYLIFCEQARSEIFFQNGIFFKKDEGYIVSKIEAKFLKSAKLGDIVEVKTYVTNIRKTSLNVFQKILLNNELIFEANITLAYLQNSKLSKIPESHLKLLNEYKI